MVTANDAARDSVVVATDASSLSINTVWADWVATRDASVVEGPQLVVMLAILMAISMTISPKWLVRMP
jgi:hypothetical protein